MRSMQRPNPAATTRRRSRVPRTILLVLVLGGIAFAFRQGLLPAMKYNPDLCRRVLVAPHIDAQPIADSPLRDGCGWTNAVRMSQAGGVRAGFDKLTCEAATALALWLEHDLQDVGQQILGQRVTAVQSFGTYSCRNIIGNPL